MSYCEDDIVNLLISSLFHTSYCEDVIVILLLCLCLTTIVTFILKKDGHLLCLCNQSFICDIRSCFTLYNLQWNKWQDFFLHIFAKYMYSYYDFYKKIILHFEKPSILVGCLTINVLFVINKFLTENYYYYLNVSK